MSNLTIDLKTTLAKNVTMTEEALTVDLVDGRTLAVPLGWFLRLLNGTPVERKSWRLIGNGEGIHWDALDEDVLVESLLLGYPSGESQHSLKKWLASR